MIGEILLCGTGSSNERRLMRHAEQYLRRELRCQGIRRSAEPYSRRSECTSDEQARDVEVALEDWHQLSANLLHFDRLFESVHGEFRLVLWTPDWLVGVQAAYELLNRYQRLLPLPADRSAMPGLAEVLAAHRRLFPLYDSKERAQHERALDTWRWTLRTGVSASLGLQLAALFQHVDAHAQSELLLASGGAPYRRGRVSSAYAARSALVRLGFEAVDLDHMVELIIGSDGTRAQLDLARLHDADDLSFFGIESWHFVELHGHEATRQHIAQLIARMSDAAICLALMTRQSPAISRMIDEALDATIPPSGVRLSLAQSAP